VAGKAALLVDPTKVDDIASGMEKVLQDPMLTRDLSEQGIERAKAFSWQETARQILKVYTTVLSHLE
jgi:glycosyltransferase involved in cell wall biosynthesis